MTAIANLPDLRPSLLLDFANSGRVDPRIQCTRPSTATCFGPDGKLRTVAANVPRIDYGPATGKCLGLLVEEARTNQLPYSSTMDIGWRKGSAASFTTDPDSLMPGATTLRALNLAGLIFSDTQNTLWAPAGAVTSGLTYTFSVYAKLLSGSPTSSLQLRVSEGGGGSGVTYSEATPLLETSWTRVSTSITVGSGATVLTIGVGTRSISEPLNCLLACPQVEVGAFPTSYIPTQASAVTRAADQVFIEGLAFTGAMSFVQGAVLCSYTARSATGNQIVLQARSASANLGFAFQFTASGGARNRALIEDGSGSPPNFSTRPVEAGVKYRAGLSWAPNTASNVVSGGFISTVTQPINTGAPQRLGLGHNGFGNSSFSGHIHDLSLYAGYIQPAQLQRLTA